MVRVGRLTKKQTTSRPDDVWPDMWKFYVRCSEKKAKQRWAIEKPKLDASSNALQNTDKEQWRKQTAILGNARRKRMCC